MSPRVGRVNLTSVGVAAAWSATVDVKARRRIGRRMEKVRRGVNR
jgi:hypothetical protein